VVVDRQSALDSRAFSSWTVQPKMAAERFGPVLESEQAGAVAEVRAATAVVPHAHVQDGAVFDEPARLRKPVIFRSLSVLRFAW
jgi:hypothetical protein